MAKIERQQTIEVDAKIRAKNFEEVSRGFTEELAKIEASRCLNCKSKPCVAGCPVSIDIPSFIMKIKDGDYMESAKIIKKSSNLPSICGRVCPQEEQCEKHCIRAKMEGAVAIGALERFVGDFSLKNSGEVCVVPSSGNSVVKPLKNVGYTAAIIGSGPASLTCAADLASSGVKVTIMEAFHRCGGVLVYGIPEFRLPKDLVKKEIDNLINLGVEVKFDTVVGKLFSLEEIKEKYDFVFIGTGAGLPNFLNIKGEGLRGVLSANEYLTRVNLMKAYLSSSDTPINKSRNVVVVGGGNVAMDAARTALRLGAKVTIVYRRSMDEMPARKEEVLHAIEEGVEFMVLTNPTEIFGDGAVSGIVLEKMRLGEADKSGRARPVVIENSKYVVNCDTVIMAVGTSPNPIITGSSKSLKTTNRGTIEVNEQTLETSIEDVYAGGDAVTGAATVILAMGAGKIAASSILNKIASKRNVDNLSEKVSN